MTEKRHVVKVTIVGEEYSIRSDATPEHTRSVARFLDEAIRRVRDANPLVDTTRATVLAALQIADELLRERETTKTLDSAIRGLSAEVRRWLPPAKRGDSVEAGSSS